MLAEAIASALPGGNSQKKNGVIIKGTYTIVWCFGHLLTLKDPEDYNPSFKVWNLRDLPIYFNDWGMKIGCDGTGKSYGARVKQIGELLKDATEVIHAGDVDEEGQLLIDEILEWFNYKGKVYRLNTSNTTKQALQKALLKMEDNSLHISSGKSAYARSLADKVFGYNLSRYYTLKNGGSTKLTIGRVQTAVLGLVVNRDNVIDNYKKTNYYEIECIVNVKSLLVKCKYVRINSEEGNGSHIDSLPMAEEISRKLSGCNMKYEIHREEILEDAPLPFNMTELNIYCEKKYQITPDEVMKITQKLRDEYKAITYNRSDCQYLSTEHFDEAPATISQICNNLGIRNRFDSNIKSRCFNDAYISAHFAIIPTNEYVDICKLTSNEKLVYEAISLFYLAQFLPKCRKSKISFKGILSTEAVLSASTTTVIDPGHKNIIEPLTNEDEVDKELEKSNLHFIKEDFGECNVDSSSVSEKETLPPKRYTRSTLFKDMTVISKYVEDAKLKKILLAKDKGKKGEHGSIGTSATRGLIIKKLIDNGYLDEKIQKKQKNIVATEKGKQLYNLLPDNIKGPEVTAKWWQIQEEVKAGRAPSDELAKIVLNEIKEVIALKGDIVIELQNDPKPIVAICPKCGSNIIENKNTFYCVGNDLVLWKNDKFFTSKKKNLTVSMVRKFVKSGEYPCKDLFSETKGRNYDAIICVDFSGDKPRYSLKFN